MARGGSSKPREPLLLELPVFPTLALLHAASNYTFLARLGPHPPSGLRAVYKPARGQSPLWDFEAGTLYRREGAAYELTKVLGWPPIPPTVMPNNPPPPAGPAPLFIQPPRPHP